MKKILAKLLIASLTVAGMTITLPAMADSFSFSVGTSAPYDSGYYNHHPHYHHPTFCELHPYAHACRPRYSDRQDDGYHPHYDRRGSFYSGY